MLIENSNANNNNVLISHGEYKAGIFHVIHIFPVFLFILFFLSAALTFLKTIVCCFLLPATLVDLAFGQPTFQISTDPEDAIAGNAVDGNPSTFAQTQNQSNPFWYVDLGESKLVRHLQITPHDTQREFLLAYLSHAVIEHKLARWAESYLYWGISMTFPTSGGVRIDPLFQNMLGGNSYSKQLCYDIDTSTCLFSRFCNFPPLCQYSIHSLART